MSITKLRTVRNWQVSRWRDSAIAQEQRSLRGRVITGMLTGGDPCADELIAAPDPRAERAR
jgi:hypothetical protein